MYTHHYFHNFNVPLSSFTSGKEHRKGLTGTSYKSTSLHIHELFGLTHILQVVMNMDWHLEPITDENIAACFEQFASKFSGKIVVSLYRFSLSSLKFIKKWIECFRGHFIGNTLRFIKIMKIILLYSILTS